MALVSYSDSHAPNRISLREAARLLGKPPDEIRRAVSVWRLTGLPSRGIVTLGGAAWLLCRSHWYVRLRIRSQRLPGRLIRDDGFSRWEIPVGALKRYAEGAEQ